MIGDRTTFISLLIKTGYGVVHAGGMSLLTKTGVFIKRYR